VNQRSLEGILHRPRDFLGNQFVYAVISQRAGGLSIGINLNPNKKCNYSCVYCEVKDDESSKERQVEMAVLSRELQNVLTLYQLNKFKELPGFASVPAELLQLKNVAFSGNGEPTLCPNFLAAVQEVARIRKLPLFPAFKMVLITNGNGLNSPSVREGLKLFLDTDEIWIKLDAGSQEYMNRINRTRASIESVLANILALGKARPIVIQSLFCSINGSGPSDDEIEYYVQRLALLQRDGAKIDHVQIYSAMREPVQSGCGHLPLARLSQIVRRVRELTGLRAEIY
jgi:wyosine [tRNA(Phe)-imidazoG37] synthetase (radical SAM superfamily)